MTQKAPVAAELDALSGTGKVIPKKRPLWDRRAEFLREHGMTPRDRFAGDWTIVRGSPAAMKNCRFLWMSDIMWRRHPILPGFSYDIYEGVTDEVARELGVQVDTKDRTKEGYIKVGDAFLMYAPEEIAKQQDTVLHRGNDISKLMGTQKKELEQRVSRLDKDTGAIGDMLLADSPDDLARAEADQRRELGATITPPQRED